MKNKLTAIGIAACLAASSISSFAADVSKFSDIPTGWAHDAVEYAVENGILKGENNQVFPDRLLTRAELAAIINRALGLSEEGDISQYDDVSESAWYYADMAIAVNAGIFKGYDASLRPEDTITREEVFAVIARAYGLKSENDDLSSYNDEKSVSEWAKPSAAALVGKGYITGDNENNLRPKEGITRAELAQILYNMAEKKAEASENSKAEEPTEVESNTEQPTQNETDSKNVVYRGGGSSKKKPSSVTEVKDESYVIMNIPYEAFYGAENVSLNDENKVNMNYDAVSSATNKVGNYGKSGGAYHVGKTAEIGEDGAITAVGGANGASNKGVIWPVKVSDISALSELGGTEVDADSSLIVATMGRGQTTSTELEGYKTLTESGDYSYYVLKEAPDYYLELTIENGEAHFTSCKGEAEVVENAEPTVTYGSNWGDVQLGFTKAEEVSDKQINAVVITAIKDGETVTAGLVHLYNVWSYSEMAWKNSSVSGLDGATITNIRYYCNNAADESELKYYIYDYSMNVKLLPKYEGEAEASFGENNSIFLTGLPEDIENLKAQVYHSTGGRNPVIEYLTPLVVDEEDDDIDPITVDVSDGEISIAYGSVTNKAGVTKEYGKAKDGVVYTVALSSDNYAPFTLTVEYSDTVTSVVVDGAEVLGGGVSADDIIKSDGSIDLTNENVFANGEDDAYLVTVTRNSGSETMLVGDRTLRNWEGNWENWQKFIFADEEYEEAYPYLDRAWSLAYDGYIAAFEKVGMGEQIKAAYPDVDALKAYWNNMTYTINDENDTEISEIVVENDGEKYILSWKDGEGNNIASDSYTMTGKMKNGLEGAIMYIFTADTLEEGSAFKYFVSMRPDMEGTEEAPIAAHYHFQFGSSLDNLLNNGEDYNGTDKNIKNKLWYATMTDKDAEDVAKYNVILGMHRAEKWSELPVE